MKRGKEYEWQHITNLSSKEFTCGHCGAQPSANEGFHGWVGDPSVQLPQEIYICHSCGKPNFFDFQGNQSPVRQIREEVFPAHISALSSEFVETYNQALTAEGLQLNKVVGPGYRRSLEFLIKDFLVSQIPADDPDITAKVHEIKNKPLGTCIDDYISNEKIKLTAKGAAYIGNDETHYTKKWLDKDVKDLKRFINLTVHWIEAEISTAEMQKEMGL